MIEFPPDRLPAEEDKAARERRVFQAFAAYASRAFGLAVIPGTIESREPPEPDILCEIRGQGPLAFELSEILDEAAMKATSTMMSARDALLAHRAALPTHDQIALQAKFPTREVRIAFRRDRTLRVIRAAIPEIYRWLLRDVADDLRGQACRCRQLIGWQWGWNPLQVDQEADFDPCAPVRRSCRRQLRALLRSAGFC